MDRALDLTLLRAAMGDEVPPSLPTADQLQDLLAEAEVGLFLRRISVPEQLLTIGWFLHGVASVDSARERYTIARQRQAFAVSAHIFDLALADPGRSRLDRLELAFAAAIGYRRGELDPNAASILRRIEPEILTDGPTRDHLDTLSVEAGITVVSFEARRLSSWLGRWRRDLSDLAALAELPNLTGTAYGTAEAVVVGSQDLLRYLTRGDRVSLDRAIAQLNSAALGEAGPGDHLARWVAAHLLGLSGDATSGSLFELLPPNLPPGAREAFTMTPPTVLTLWQPQRDLIAAKPDPLDPSTRRLVLSVPTSSGKTLMAQMLTVAHLAQSGSGVCYVAPTRSLCREVRRTLAARVRVLQKEVSVDGPDFPAWNPAEGEDLLHFISRGLDGVAQDAGGDIDVMTPERLAHQLRHDASAVLDRFGMFIFDEAQLVQESGRGFLLESTIALLNYLTTKRDHRIVLISAAMGNTGQIMRWVDADGTGILHESDWRGPRRLHAMFSTQPDWTPIRVESSRSKQTPYRQFFDEYGVVALRPVSGRIRRLRTTEPVGTRVLKARTADQTVGRSTDTDRSTRNYVMASTMIRMLGHAGSVLVVANTRSSAERLARQLATGQAQRPEFVPLADFARQQLGGAHPLVETLTCGVGYHHAGLPTEVLEAMEDALRSDTLAYLTCTSTLTEGVNLPVRTVVLYDEQYVEAARLTPGRLVNAMGRAGRAGKESEGWIILLRPGRSDATAMNDLTPTDDDLQVRSTLVSDSALQQMAQLENAMRDSEDALLAVSAGTAADFISFVWMVLSASEDLDEDPTQQDLEALLDSTLAAQQVSSHTRTRWIATAEAVRRTYLRTDPSTRRRWALTGTSLQTARVLDRLAGRINEFVRNLPPDQVELLSLPHPTLDLLAELHVLDMLLALPENQSPWRFQVRPSAAAITVAVEQVLRGWIDGSSLTELANDLLSEASDPAWRISTLVDHVTAHFEHFLAWTVSALLESVNATFEREGHPARLCPEFGGYIRYGVNSELALSLALAGVRSRRLLHAVTGAAPDSSDLLAVRDWLSSLSLSEWRTILHASPTEVLDLLDLTRARRGSLLRPLLETGTASVQVRVTRTAFDDRSGLVIRAISGEPTPAPLGVYAGDALVAVVPPAYQSDVEALLDAGLDINLSLSPDSDELTVALAREINDR